MDQVTNISGKLGKGGRLYKDARDKAAGDAEATPAPRVERKAPGIPRPWHVQAVKSEPQQRVAQQPAARSRDWQQITATMLQVIGMSVMSAGFALLFVWLGLIVLGICLIVLGIAWGLPQPPSTPKPAKKRTLNGVDEGP